MIGRWYDTMTCEFCGTELVRVADDYNPDGSVRFFPSCSCQKDLHERAEGVEAE